MRCTLVDGSRLRRLDLVDERRLRLVAGRRRFAERDRPDEDPVIGVRPTRLEICATGPVAAIRSLWPNRQQEEGKNEWDARPSERVAAHRFPKSAQPRAPTHRQSTSVKSKALPPPRCALTVAITPQAWCQDADYEIASRIPLRASS